MEFLYLFKENFVKGIDKCIIIEYNTHVQREKMLLLYTKKRNNTTFLCTITTI